MKPLSDFELSKRALVLGLAPNELTVLLILLSHGCKSWPSVERISLMMKRNPRRVQYILKSLCKRGLVSAQPRYWDTNIYRVNAKEIIRLSAKRAKEIEAAMKKRKPTPAENSTPHPAENSPAENSTLTDNRYIVSIEDSGSGIETTIASKGFDFKKSNPASRSKEPVEADVTLSNESQGPGESDPMPAKDLSTTPSTPSPANPQVSSDFFKPTPAKTPRLKWESHPDGWYSPKGYESRFIVKRVNEKECLIYDSLLQQNFALASRKVAAFIRLNCKPLATADATRGGKEAKTP